MLYDTERARVVVFGLRTLLGGGESTGYALIYDDEAAQRKGEPTYRLVRVCIYFSSSPSQYALVRPRGSSCVCVLD